MDDLTEPQETEPRVTHDEAAKAFTYTLRGVDVGAYERRIVEWLGQWEPGTIHSIASLIGRARIAARAEGCASTPEGQVQTSVHGRATCPVCGRDVALTKGGVLHHHINRSIPTSGGFAPRCRGAAHKPED